MIVGRNNFNGEFWAIVSDKKTLQTFAEYGLRFDIEENFPDDQRELDEKIEEKKRLRCKLQVK